MKPDRVRPEQYAGIKVPVKYANETRGELPLAWVNLSWLGDAAPQGLRRVGVCEAQTLDCYLGMDHLPEVRAAITRAQSQRKAQAVLDAMGETSLEVP